MDLKKNIEIADLFDIYGSLLTKKQYKIMQSYYDFDFSLSEIAQNEKISRSAVLDAIKKSIATLYKYETHLNILRKNKEIDELLLNNAPIDEIIKTIKRRDK